MSTGLFDARLGVWLLFLGVAFAVSVPAPTAAVGPETSWTVVQPSVQERPPGRAGSGPAYPELLPRVTVDHEPGDPIPPITTEMLVVFGIILIALVLFSWEPFPMDITAILIMVSLILLQPWTGISAPEGVSGFASIATITVLAMFILSEGIRRTGIIQKMGSLLVNLTGGSLKKQLLILMGFVAPSSGFLNNTAVVAILLPMVTEISARCKNSPSKLLIPLSYASMFGGMLTVIGTSTNILASDLSHRLLGRSIGMFEFTHLGAIVSIVGAGYLITVGQRLLPARIKPEEDLTERFEMRDYLTEVVVPAGSPLVGRRVNEAIEETGLDVDVIQLIREGDAFIQPIGQKAIVADDVLVLRTDRPTLLELVEIEGLELLPDIEVTEAELEKAEQNENLVEVILGPDSSLAGETLQSLSFRQRFDATVLALRHGGELIRTRIDRKRLSVGDILLIQATGDSIERLRRNRDFIVAQEIQFPDHRSSKIPVALAIIAGVVITAALDILPILASALTGAILMVITGCLKPSEIYDAVHWNVIVLLAGVIPLGIAMEKCGAADLIAAMIAQSQTWLPLIGVLGLMYVITALLTNIVSNNASVLLMIPVAIDTALRLDANPFAFVIAVTFAASTAFMTPMGYQTNLFVYGPGGYRFSDYLKVGAPLQALIALVTTIGIAYFWPL